jgi:hypothetical protein
MQPTFSPIARIARTSSPLSWAAPLTAASSARLSSIGRAARPLSWISVGATQRTPGCERFHAHASCSIVSPWRAA